MPRLPAPRRSQSPTRFVKLGGESFLICYNSKLPVVIYVPEGTEVRYRVWRGDGEGRKVDEG